MLFWIYSLISILMCWILYRLTNKSKHILIFYILSLILLLFYFIVEIYLMIYYNLKYRSDRDSLKCKEQQCKTCHLNNDCDELCDKNSYECEKDIFCKIENEQCLLKDDCQNTINNYKNNISNKIKKDKKDILNWLDENNIRKKDFEKYIKFYLIILTFVFLCYLIILLLLGKITIQWTFIQRDLNYIKRRMTDVI